MRVRTYLGRDRQTGKRSFKSRGPIKETSADRYFVASASVYKWARRRRLLSRGFISPSRGVERAGEKQLRVRFLDQAEREGLLAMCRLAAWVRLYLLVLMAITTGVRRSSRRCGCNTTKSKLSQIEFVNKYIDESNRVVFTNIVIETFRQQPDLMSVFALNESFHLPTSFDR